MLRPGKKKSKEMHESASAAGRVSVVAQELKFAKMLASNDVNVRNGVLKSLKKWLNTRSQSSYRKFILIASICVTVCYQFNENMKIQLEKTENFFNHKASLRIIEETN